MLFYLIKESRWLFITATIAGVMSGLCGVLLLTVINSVIAAETQTSAMQELWPFVAYVTIGMLMRMLASILFQRLKEHAHANMRLFITSRVLATDYNLLQRLGGAKIQSALTDHSANVSNFFINLPKIIMNGVIVLGCLTYLAVLSLNVLLIAIIVIALGGLCYHFVHLKAIKHLKVASKEQDNLFSYFDSLIAGAKELKLHREKRNWFKEEVLGKSIDKVRSERTKGMSMFVISVSWSNFLIYGFIGVVLFWLVGDVDNRVELMTGFTLLFIYMITPLESLLLNLPKANLANISAKHIDDVTSLLNEENNKTVDVEMKSFTQLTFENVSHSYYHEQSDEFFSLPEINLTINRAELIYLVGGNGSGKTTLAKLITGLYNPEQGRVILDNKELNSSDRDNFRQLFSSVFSDFHLFDTLLSNSSKELETKGNTLIKKLNLHHKVKIENGKFTTKSLSQGQRKRLALVVSYIEDRPFYLFDEWAADQDPTFKDVFYKELLPELTAKGKTVFVISHDDKYFHLADRLLKMDNGHLSEIPVPTV